MAQTSNFMPQYNQGYFFREVFPNRLQINWILVFGIAKCILGSLLFITGIVNVAIVEYNTKIAFAIWCGLTVSSLLAGLSHVRPIQACIFISA